MVSFFTSGLSWPEHLYFVKSIFKDKYRQLVHRAQCTSAFANLPSENYGFAKSLLGLVFNKIH